MYLYLYLYLYLCVVAVYLCNSRRTKRKMKTQTKTWMEDEEFSELDSSIECGMKWSPAKCIKKQVTDRYTHTHLIKYLLVFRYKDTKMSKRRKFSVFINAAFTAFYIKCLSSDCMYYICTYVYLTLLLLSFSAITKMTEDFVFQLPDAVSTTCVCVSEYLLPTTFHYAKAIDTFEMLNQWSFPLVLIYYRTCSTIHTSTPFIRHICVYVCI